MEAKNLVQDTKLFEHLTQLKYSEDLEQPEAPIKLSRSVSSDSARMLFSPDQNKLKSVFEDSGMNIFSPPCTDPESQENDANAAKSSKKSKRAGNDDNNNNSNNNNGMFIFSPPMNKPLRNLKNRPQATPTDSHGKKALVSPNVTPILDSRVKKTSNIEKDDDDDDLKMHQEFKCTYCGCSHQLNTRSIISFAADEEHLNRFLKDIGQNLHSMAEKENLSSIDKSY